MTRDQWLEIAGRAGWMQVLWKSQYPEALDCLERFALGVEALVREECAKEAETLGVHPELNVYNGGPDWYQHGKEIAAAIRARGETK